MDALSACVYFLIEYELKIIISTTLILIQNWELFGYILDLINIYEIIFIMLYICKTILLTYRIFFKLKQKYFQY